MNKRTYLIGGLMAALLGLSACKKSMVNEDGSLFPLKEYTELTGEQICPDVLMKTPDDLLIAGDWLLINDRQTDSLLHAINLNNLDNYKRLAPVGQGPYDFVSIMDMHYDGQELGIYDSMGKTYSYFKVDKGDIKLDETTFTHRDKFEKSSNITISGSYSPFGDNYVTVGLEGTNALIVKDKTGEVVSSFAPYPGDTLGISDPLTFMLKRVWFCTTNPKKDIAVAAGSTSDWLAFYKLGAQGPEKIKEYYTFETEREADVRYNDKHQLISLSLDNGDAIDTFSDLKPTENHLYVQYRGFRLDDDNPDNPCYVLQFDWEGNLLKAYKFHELIGAFDVDEKRGYLYAHYTPDGEDPQLWRYKLK